MFSDSFPDQFPPIRSRIGDRSIRFAPMKAKELLPILKERLNKKVILIETRKVKLIPYEETYNSKRKHQGL